MWRGAFTKKMKVLDLFAGIGGFSLAAHWMGWETAAFVEWDAFCQKVLAKNFPNVPIYGDIKDVTVDNYGNLLYIAEENVITMGQPKSTKYDNAANLYRSGMSIQDCADFYEISRQAMHKILQRRGCEFRDNLKHGEQNHFHRGCLPDKAKKERAHNLVEKAIKRGILTNPQVCSTCKNTYTFKDGRTAIQAHHSDYDKPLDVIWLCQKCHHKWHKNNIPLNEQDKEKQKEPSGAVDIVSGGFP